MTVPGRRSHCARGWLGENAIHGVAPLLTRLVAYEAWAVEIDGCTFGPGDPNLAHTREEHVDVCRITEAERALRSYLIA